MTIFIYNYKFRGLTHSIYDKTNQLVKKTI